MADEPNESGGNFDIPTLNLRLGHKKLIGCVSRLLTLRRQTGNAGSKAIEMRHDVPRNRVCGRLLPRSPPDLAARHSLLRN
jgi:hypothetical protein